MPVQVYEKLAQVKSWNEWHKSAWVVRAPGQERLLPGDRFSYTGTNFVMGNVQAEVSEASPSKVTLLSPNQTPLESCSCSHGGNSHDRRCVQGDMLD